MHRNNEGHYSRSLDHELKSQLLTTLRGVSKFPEPPTQKRVAVLTLTRSICLLLIYIGQWYHIHYNIRILVSSVPLDLSNLHARNLEFDEGHEEIWRQPSAGLKRYYGNRFTFFQRLIFSLIYFLSIAYVKKVPYSYIPTSTNTWRLAAYKRFPSFLSSSLASKTAPLMSLKRMLDTLLQSIRR